MASVIGGRLFSVCICLVAYVFCVTPAAAENLVNGKLVVDGKPFEIRKVYAYAQEGFFDKKKQDIVVLSCSAAVPPEVARDNFARKPLIESGELQCVEQVISSEKQVINFTVEAKRFGSTMPSGASTENVFDAKTFDGKTIAGRSYTKSTQKSFGDVTYSYDITFSAAIEPMK
jgi:hypothetical protein